MSIKETNKILSITNINKSLNTWCVTRQQTEASVSHNIPLGTHVNTTNTVAIRFSYMAK